MFQTQLTCQYGPSPSVDEAREQALAEVDVAYGASIEKISPEQEWEIRKSLGREMGLSPGEVNGWRDIYRERAENAQNKLKNISKLNKLREPEKKQKQLAACEEMALMKNEIEILNNKVPELKEEIASQRGKWPIWVKTILAIFGFMAASFISIVIFDNKNKRKLKNDLLQIHLDGQIRLFEIFKDSATLQQSAEIKHLYDDRNLDGLRDAVSRLAMR